LVRITAPKVSWNGLEVSVLPIAGTFCAAPPRGGSGLITLGLVLDGGILFPIFGFHWIAF
jgi:hypothetical protein